MGFKLPGRSIQTGTSGHRSALKMLAHVAPSPVKKHVKGHGTYKGALEANPELEKLIAARNKEKDRGGDYKTSTAYGDAQNAINKAYYGPDFKNLYAGTPIVENKETEVKVIPEKKTDATVKADKNIEKVTKKATKKKSEIDENLSVKETKIKRKEARKNKGRGSVEHLEAKLKVKEAKASDIQGEKGGKKRGIFRGLATKINLKRQKKLKDKISKKGGGTTEGESTTGDDLGGGKPTRKYKRLSRKLDKLQEKQLASEQNSIRSKKLSIRQGRVETKLEKEGKKPRNKKYEKKVIPVNKNPSDQQGNAVDEYTQVDDYAK